MSFSILPGENGEGLWHAVQVIINDWTWHIPKIIDEMEEEIYNFPKKIDYFRYL